MNNLHNISSNYTDLEKACLWWFNDRHWYGGKVSKFLRKQGDNLLIIEPESVFKASTNLEDVWGPKPIIDTERGIYSSGWHTVYYEWIHDNRPEPTIR